MRPERNKNKSKRNSNEIRGERNNHRVRITPKSMNKHERSKNELENRTKIIGMRKTTTRKTTTRNRR